MSDYLLLCSPEAFAEEFPDVDPCDDLGLKRANILGREVLFARYVFPIYMGDRFPDGYNREHVAWLLPNGNTKSNKHQFAQSVLVDEQMLDMRLADWLEDEDNEEDEFYYVPEHRERKASIAARKASDEYDTSRHYLAAFHWFARNCQILDLQLKP
jgi:hypothetical protein